MHRYLIALILIAAVLVPAAPAETLRDALLARLRARREGAASNEAPAGDTEQITLAGLHTYVWRPPGTGRHPLVIFSHGLHGAGSQSRFLTREMARNGYLVIAPDHNDSVRGMLFDGAPLRPQVSFGRPDAWTDAVYADRRDDIRGLVAALKADPTWNAQIDWTKFALAGHSLGGYTAMGLAGAWPSWKMEGVKAVLALSPAVLPFVRQHTLTNVHVPVMYQGGTEDRGITPTLERAGGAYDQSLSPCIFVKFQGAGHFAFSDIRHEGHEGMLAYSIAFLDRYVKGDQTADPTKRLDGLADFRVK